MGYKMDNFQFHPFKFSFKNVIFTLYLNGYNNLKGKIKKKKYIFLSSGSNFHLVIRLTFKF